MKYNIALIPSLDVEKKAVEISKVISRHGGVFTLGEENKAHITIAHFNCDDPTILMSIMMDVKSILHPCSDITLTQENYREKDGWIDVVYEETLQMTELYRAICVILNKYDCEKTSQAWSENPPHLTFSRIIKKEIVCDLSQLPVHDLSFSSRSIGLYTLGEHGTNNTLLHIFTL